MTEAVIDAEVVEDTPAAATDLAPVTTADVLFKANTPEEVLERALAVADTLKPTLDRNMTTIIQGRQHINVEGWQTLGSMLGITPVCVWTRKLSEPHGGWEARVEARTLDGRVIGAAEAQCDRGEKTWKTRDDHTLRSMAQTRATSKALGSVLRFVVTLAGFDATPAEEMVAASPQLLPADEEQLRLAKRALGVLAGSGDAALEVYTAAHEQFGGYIPAAFASALVAIATAKESANGD